MYVNTNQYMFTNNNANFYHSCDHSIMRNLKMDEANLFGRFVFSTFYAPHASINSIDLNFDYARA